MILIPLLLLGICVALCYRRMHLMPRLYAACLCVLLTSQGCTKAPPSADNSGSRPTANWRRQERTKETFRDVADRMVKAINAADFEALRMDFNKELLEAFPVETCRMFFSKEIAGKYGKINKLEPPQFKSAAEAVFVARCERGALDFTLTLDDQGRVAGMLFRPRTDGAWNMNLIQPNYAGAPRSDGPSGAWLAGLITDLRKENKLVGLAAMVLVDGQVLASAADGERKAGSGVPIELGDRWHVGSVTKSIRPSPPRGRS
jgi:hypothetical protein